MRDSDSLIPVEVKANDNATASLNNLIKKDCRIVQCAIHKKKYRKYSEQFIIREEKNYA